MEKLEGIPALLYSLFWQTYEMGFLREILSEMKIEKLKVLFLFKDYLPGALLNLDGETGNYEIKEIFDFKEIEYNCAVIGYLKDIVSLMAGKAIIKGFFLILLGKLKLKGIKNLLKFIKILGRLAI